MRTDFYFHNLVHYSYANIIQALALFISQKVFLIEEWTISTYHKAVQRSLQTNLSAAKQPTMIVDPTLALEVDETSKQHWRFPIAYNLNVAKTLFKPIVKTDDVYITPHFITLNMRFDIITWFESVYQKLDYDTHMLMYFGGLDRYSKPYSLLYDAPLPDGLELALDLAALGFSKQVIPSIGHERYVLPVHVEPLIKLESLSDGSEKYGANKLPVWQSVATIEMKVHLLTGLNVIYNWKLQDLYINLKSGEYGVVPNANIATYVGTADIVQDNPDYANLIEFKFFKEIKPGFTDLVFAADKDYTPSEWFTIDLSSYNFTEIEPLVPVDVTYDYDDTTKILNVSGPLYKGQHIHIAIKEIS